jgi:type I restriction enzyme S subunit
MYTGNSIAESEKSTKYAGLTEGYDYIATKDVSFKQKIEYDNGVRIPFDSTFKRAYKDSILMCIEGGSAGRKIGILDRDVCFGNKLCMFRADKVSNTFLFYYLQSTEFKKLFSENMTGIIGGVSIKKLKEILIPIPPLAEQKRIVAKIEELLPYIDRYDQAWRKLEDFNKRFPVDMKKSILQFAIQGKLVEQRPDEGTGEELYRQIQAEKQRLIKAGTIKKEKPLLEMAEDEMPFDIPESWKWVKLSTVCSKITDGEHKTPRRTSEYCGYYLLSARNVRDGHIQLDDVDFVDQAEYKLISSRCNPQIGDVLISCSGSVGRCAMVNDDNKYVMVRSAAMASPVLIDSKFLMYGIQSAVVQAQIRDKTKQTAQANLFQDAIRNLIIPLPPLAEQKRIVAKLEEILPLCEKLKR